MTGHEHNPPSSGAELLRESGSAALRVLEGVILPPLLPPGTDLAVRSEQTPSEPLDDLEHATPDDAVGALYRIASFDPRGMTTSDEFRDRYRDLYPALSVLLPELLRDAAPDEKGEFALAWKSETGDTVHKIKLDYDGELQYSPRGSRHHDTRAEANRRAMLSGLPPKEIVFETETAITGRTGDGEDVSRAHATSVRIHVDPRLDRRTQLSVSLQGYDPMELEPRQVSQVLLENRLRGERNSTVAYGVGITRGGLQADEYDPSELRTGAYGQRQLATAVMDLYRRYKEQGVSVFDSTSAVSMSRRYKGSRSGLRMRGWGR